MKRRLQQALLVEGKYDAARLANLVEGIILTTDGFAVFKDRAMQDLLKRTARVCGLVILTDSDAAGSKYAILSPALLARNMHIRRLSRRCRAKSGARSSRGKKACWGWKACRTN